MWLLIGRAVPKKKNYKVELVNFMLPKEKVGLEFFLFNIDSEKNYNRNKIDWRESETWSKNWKKIFYILKTRVIYETF